MPPNMWGPSPWDGPPVPPKPKPDAQVTEQVTAQVTAQVATKGFFTSRTVWTGACIFALSFLTLLEGSEIVQQDPRGTSMVGMGIGIVMIMLRMITTTELALPTVTVYRSGQPVVLVPTPPATAADTELPPSDTRSWPKPTASNRSTPGGRPPWGWH